MRDWLFALACVAGCRELQPGALPKTRVLAPEMPTSTLPARHAPGPPAPVCAASPVEVGRVSDPRLDEISGVIESRRNPGLLFVHNDSGDSPRFFAIDRRGNLRAELSLSSVPLLIDAEDIAQGPGPGGENFIYLGDTGNNFASFGQGIPRRKAVLYRFSEPEVPAAEAAQRLAIAQAFPIVLTFPRGARDVEAFFVEPRTGDLYLLTKQPADHRSQLLQASAATLAAGGGELRLLAELELGHAAIPGSTMPTAASISRDGGRILVRTYDSVLLFRRAAGESVQAALERPPEELPSPHEPQGEAITFVDDDRAFLTLSEGVGPAIHCVQLPD
jgi:hypothetical protein